MAYIDGFILAVPKDNKDKFIHHAEQADSAFMEWGATRILECWEDDVPDGKQTDFRRAVQARDDEAVVFAWVEWPDKATRDAAFAKCMDNDNPDPRIDQAKNPMPFDGMRLVYGGFKPVVNLTK